MKNTENYGFNLPEKGEFYNVEDFNENFEGIDGKLKEFEDGTTPVGNANKLGGKGASEYALAEQIKNNTICTSLTSGFDLNNAYGKYRTHTGSIVNTLLNLPPTSLNLQSCEIIVEWIPSHQENRYGKQVVTLSNGGVIEEFERAKNGDTWGAWKQTATTADLANYLPLSGGKLNAPTNVPLELQSGSDNTCAIKYIGVNGVALGFLGLGTEGQGLLYNKDGQEVGTLLHTGNKPSGTYTGNGSATSRYVEMGGIGNVVYVRGDDGFAIVTNGGFIGMRNGAISGGTSAYITEGRMKISTTDDFFNTSGKTYTYQFL